MLLYLFSFYAIGSTFSTNSLQALFEEYYRWKQRTYPEWASKTGWRSEDFSLRGIYRKMKSCEGFLKRSRAITTENEELKTYQSIMEVCINFQILWNG